MSYSFNWDCTLPIKNIEDIVSINIVPETTAHDEGDYLSLRGQICIDGEYLSSTKEQFLFNECIPLDITLPNNHRSADIKIDVENFDYTIEDGNKLCLNINLCIAGYSLDSTPTLVEVEEDEDEIHEQPPVIFTKEAIIAPKSVAESKLSPVSSTDEEDLDYLDFDEVAMPSHQDAVVLDEDDSEVEDTSIPKPFLAEGARKETLTDKIKQILNKEPVPVAVEKTQPVVEKVEETKVPVVETVEEVVETKTPVVETVKEVVETKAPVVETVEEVVETKAPVVETIEEVVETKEPVVEKVQVSTPELTGWEEVIKEHTATIKTHPVMPIPVVQEEVEEPEETIEELIELIVEPLEEVGVVEEEEEEEILPYPLKETTQTVVEVQSTVKEKSKIFDMLYGLDTEEIEEEVAEEIPSEIVEEIVEAPTQLQSKVVVAPVVQAVQTSVQPLVQEVEVTDYVQNESPVVITPAYNDSIASQFSDGESVIKIVFVQEEETTINDICTKYNVSEEHIYNCPNVPTPLCPGDHVMINYGQYRRN